MIRGPCHQKRHWCPNCYTQFESQYVKFASYFVGQDKKNLIPYMRSSWWSFVSKLVSVFSFLCLFFLFQIQAHTWTCRNFQAFIVYKFKFGLELDYQSKKRSIQSSTIFGTYKGLSSFTLALELKLCVAGPWARVSIQKQYEDQSWDKGPPYDKTHAMIHPLLSSPNFWSQVVLDKGTMSES